MNQKSTTPIFHRPWFWLVGLAAVGFALFLYAWPREPVHEDRPLSAWLESFDGNSISLKRAHAIHAIQTMGPEALPHLIHEIQLTHDPVLEFLKPWRWAYRQANALVTPPDRRRSRAFRALQTLGTNAEPAVPTLLRILQDTNDWDNMRIFSAQTLGRTGATPTLTVPALILLATNRTEKMALRRECILSLGRLGPLAQPAVPSLLHLATNETLWSDVASVAALRRIDPAAAESVGGSLPQLINAFDDAEEQILRSLSILMLAAQIDDQVTNALVPLQTLQGRTTNATVRHRALNLILLLKKAEERRLLQEGYY